MGATERLKPPRWVLDTNVVLSALLFPAGRTAWLRDAWRTRELTPLVNRDTTTELLRVLAYPRFALTPGEREDLLAEYLPFAESVRASAAPPVPECRDPFDRVFLELAVAGQADSVVTGDQDLLVLAPRFRIPIMRPDEARRRWFGDD